MDGAVHVGFGGEMYHGVKFVRTDEILNQGLVEDISMHESKFSRFFYVCQISPISCIGQRVKDNDNVLRICRAPITHKIGTDKPCSTRNEKLLH
jgi:hypothetical protein